MGHLRSSRLGILAAGRIEHGVEIGIGTGATKRDHRHFLPVIRSALRCCLHLAFLFLILGNASARAESADSLTVYVITGGPGDHPFAKFSHSEIWIHDETAPADRPLLRDPVYNYGTFDFDDPALIPKFILGRFVYWLAKQPIGERIALYRQLNVSLEAQELNLTAVQKRTLFEALEENAREENRSYLYDYYRDNCATRVRDVIDRLVEGRLQSVSIGPADMTFRQHTLRLTADNTVLTLALNLVLAGTTDRPINQWEEMFLGTYVQQGLRRVRVPDSRGGDVPLVVREFPLVKVQGRPAPPRSAPSWWLPHLLLGLLFGAMLYVMCGHARHSPLARLTLGAMLAAVGTLSLIGLFLLFVWAATDHDACHRNENILQFAPFGVLLLGCLPGVVRLCPASLAQARRLISCAAVISLFGLAWKVLPCLRQDNVWLIAFCVPMWMGGTLGLSELETALRRRIRQDPWP